MRESNFHFPAHNKASVVITSALYDRRAIDSTSPLPLLSTLTHLSYLTSTSPRIREILCSDGGLERLITILRTTGQRMREHRDRVRSPLIPPPTIELDIIPSSLGLFRISPTNPSTPTFSHLTSTSNNPGLIHSRVPHLFSSPFRSFFNPPPSTRTNELHTQPMAAHQAATLGLSREEKQILWTWSLSFQCVVNVGVRGSELVRTRVVEAGVVPVIISVLGGYLHEMERIRQQSEARERVRRKSVLAPSQPSALSRSLSPADIPRPPRPVLAPRTLHNPQAPPTQNPFPPTSPSRPHNAPVSAENEVQARPSPLRLSFSSGRQVSNSNTPSNLQASTSQNHLQHTNAPSQLSARSDGSGSIGNQPPVNPISITSSTTTQSGFRTGSISPSSVSSSSSLETSRLLSARLSHVQHQLLVRTVTPDALQSSVASGSGSEVEMDDHHQPVTQAAGAANVDVDGSNHIVERPTTAFDADESEEDVVMELAGDEPGPSSSSRNPNNSDHNAHRPRRGTIKSSLMGSNVVQINPSGPPSPTTVTDLEEQSLSSNNPHGSEHRPMEGIESSDGHVSPNTANKPSCTEHQTPRASSSTIRLTTTPRTVTQRQAGQDPAPGTEDVTMAGPPDSDTTLANLFNPSPREPPPRPRPEAQTLAAAQLQRILSEADNQEPPPTNPPTMIPITITNPGTPPVPALPTAAPTTVAPLTSPALTVTLGFRDEDVLLALQLLAYLSKYPHVRAHFHEPASRATLELTYGTMLEATRALARFVGRYKSDRHERERAKQAIIAMGGGPNNLNPNALSSGVSARRGAHAAPSEWTTPNPATGTLPGAFTTPPPNMAHITTPHGHQVALAQLNRATASGTGDRSSRAEAYVRAFSTREPMYSFPPPTDRENPVSGTLPLSTEPTAFHRGGPEHINPLSTNVFSYVERFTHRKPSNDLHTPSIPTEIQYWAGVIMRNACRKDEDRGGIRQCANMQCGKWESFQREFAKCRRCRKAKYCSKACQSKAWQLGHRFWCCTKSEYDTTTDSATVVVAGSTTSPTAAAETATTTDTTIGGPAATISEPPVAGPEVAEADEAPEEEAEQVLVLEEAAVRDMPDEEAETPVATTPIGEETSTGTTTPAPAPVPVPVPAGPEPGPTLDAAIARLRRRRSTISLVTTVRGAGAIATPPDQEIGVGIGRVNVGLVAAATVENTPVPAPVEEAGERAIRVVEEEEEQEEEAIRLATDPAVAPVAVPDAPTVE